MKILDARPTARKMFFLHGAKRSEKEQEELEKNFFQRIRLRNKVFKTTHARRLDDLNAKLNSMLPGNCELQLMDVAISSGVSTFEWSDSLNSEGIPHRMVAGDLVIKTCLVSVGRHLHVLTDWHAFPLQFDIFGVAVPNSDGGCKRYAVPISLLHTAFGLLLTMKGDLREYLKGESDRFLRKKGGAISCRPVDLVSPRVASNPKIDLIEDDILLNADKNLQHRFHALRAANILNREYFDDDTIVRMLLNLRGRLRAGGLLAVCKTDEAGRNNGTIFRLTEAGTFETGANVGGGSDIRNVVLGLS